MDKEIIELIKRDENAGFEVMYREYFDKSCAVMHKRGLKCDEEKKDVFQTSLLAFVIITRKEDFKLTSRLSTLFFGIVIRQCYKVFNYKSKFMDNSCGEDEEDIIKLIPDPHSLENSVSHAEINQIIQDEMGDNSKMKILNLMFIEGKNQKEIADELGYAGVDSIKSQKYKAVKSMRKTLAKKYGEEELRYYID